MLPSCARLALACAVAVWLPGCGPPVRYSVREVPHPIVLGQNPVLGDGQGFARSPVGSWTGKTRDELMAAGGTYVSMVSHEGESTAQITSSRALGGRTDRAIVGVDFRVQQRFVFLIAGMWAKTEVTSTGQVVELRPEGAAP